MFWFSFTAYTTRWYSGKYDMLYQKYLTGVKNALFNNDRTQEVKIYFLNTVVDFYTKDHDFTGCDNSFKNTLTEPKEYDIVDDTINAFSYNEKVTINKVSYSFLRWSYDKHTKRLFYLVYNKEEENVRLVSHEQVTESPTTKYKVDIGKLLFTTRRMSMSELHRELPYGEKIEPFVVLVWSETTIIYSDYENRVHYINNDDNEYNEPCGKNITWLYNKDKENTLDILSRYPLPLTFDAIEDTKCEIDVESGLLENSKLELEELKETITQTNKEISDVVKIFDDSKNYLEYLNNLDSLTGNLRSKHNMLEALQDQIYALSKLEEVVVIE